MRGWRRRPIKKGRDAASSRSSFAPPEGPLAASRGEKVAGRLLSRRALPAKYTGSKHRLLRHCVGGAAMTSVDDEARRSEILQLEQDLANLHGRYATLKQS